MSVSRKTLKSANFSKKSQEDLRAVLRSSKSEHLGQTITMTFIYASYKLPDKYDSDRH